MIGAGDVLSKVSLIIIFCNSENYIVTYLRGLIIIPKSVLKLNLNPLSAIV